MTEIWGRDEMKNADLWGGDEIKNLDLLGDETSKGSYIHKKPKNRHIMAKR